MAFWDDWSDDTAAKTVTHTSGTTVYSVNEMYSAILDRWTGSAYMDDDVPIKANTPDIYEWINGYQFGVPGTDIQFLTAGAIDDKVNNDTFVNVKTIGSIEAGSEIYVVQNGTKITSWWPAGHIDILVQVKDNNVLIDTGELRLFNREYQDLYDHFILDASSSLVNTVALATSPDPNNTTAEGTVSGWTDVTITEGSISRDLDNGAGAKNYDVEIDCGGRPLAEMYERLKWVARKGSTTQLLGADGEQYISMDEDTYAIVKVAPYGTFAGGKYFGAQAVWIKNYDAADGENFQLIADDGTTQSPPSQASVTVTSLSNADGGDSVLLSRLSGSGGTILKPYTAAAGNDSADPTLVVKESIASDEPKVGWVRILDDTYAYTDWTGSTFTLAGTLSTSYTENDVCWVPIIDDRNTSGTTLSNSWKYANDDFMALVVRKSDGTTDRIIPFETEISVGVGGNSVGAIRVADAIIT